MKRAKNRIVWILNLFYFMIQLWIFKIKALKLLLIAIVKILQSIKLLLIILRFSIYNSLYWNKEVKIALEFT